jgi:(S)-2-hydroxy-acid oxidase
VLGRRLNEFRNSFALPEGIAYPNIESEADPSALEGGDDNLNYGTGCIEDRAWFSLMSKKDADVDWATVIPWLKSHTTLPIWVKGRK